MGECIPTSGCGLHQPGRTRAGKDRQTDQKLLLVCLGGMCPGAGWQLASSPTSCSVEPLPGKSADVQKPGMGGIIVQFQVGITQLLNFSAIPLDHRGIAGWKSTTFGMFFTMYR